jgi:dienelactone hydrolase
MNRLNCLGSYGEEIANLTPFPGSLSFLKEEHSHLESWKAQAREKVRELLSPPDVSFAEVRKSVRVLEREVFDGLEVETLAWQLPYGPRTLAYYLKPEGRSDPLPGMLGLHDHGGIKFFGKEKIARLPAGEHPRMREHRQTYYSGRAWANDLARRGYGVLVHDVFPFSSRRFVASDLPDHVVKRIMKPPEAVEELTQQDIACEVSASEYGVPAKPTGDHVRRYDAFAAQHEHVVAKSLFSAGLTWPGLALCEDLAALEILSARPEIDSSRLGCCGLSGGGSRANFLAGLDDRIRCAVSVGFMTTWRDFLLNVSFTHTWMAFLPLLPRYLEFPEILGMRVPFPALVQASSDDPLYTDGEIRRAGRILSEVYHKAGCPERFRFSLYQGPHRFDQSMQEEAFGWLDSWLGENNPPSA